MWGIGLREYVEKVGCKRVSRGRKGVEEHGNYHII